MLYEVITQVKAKTIVGINKENNLVFMIVEQPLQREDNTKNNHREVMTTNEMIAYLEEKGVITSYSIHYTKLYDERTAPVTWGK